MKRQPPLAVLVVFVLAASIESSAWAAPAKRVGLVPFEGPTAERVQYTARKVIEGHGFRVVVLSDGPGPDDSPGQDAAARAAAAGSSSIGIISGLVEGRGKKLTATILLRDAENGDVVKEKSWTSKRGPALLLKLVKKGMWPVFGGTLTSLRPAAAAKPAEPEVAAAPVRSAPPARAVPPPAPEPVAEPIAEAPRTPVAHVEPSIRRESDRDDEVTVARDRKAAPSVVDVAVGPRVGARTFTYKNVPDAPLNELKTSRPSMALGFGAAWVPYQRSLRLGAQVQGQYGSRIQASSDTQDYEIRTNELVAGALVGLPLRWATLDLTIGGGMHDSKVAALGDAGSQPPPVPGVAYRFVRAGGELGIYTGTPLAFRAGGYYRHILSAGEIASDAWFPNLTAYGMEAMAGASYRITPWLEARLQADGQRYRYHMNVNEGDPHVAGGAVDQYWSVWFGAAGVFGGNIVR